MSYVIVVMLEMLYCLENQEGVCAGPSAGPAKVIGDVWKVTCFPFCGYHNVCLIWKLKLNVPKRPNRYFDPVYWPKLLLVKRQLNVKAVLATKREARESDERAGGVGTEWEREIEKQGEVRRGERAS